MQTVAFGNKLHQQFLSAGVKIKTKMSGLGGCLRTRTEVPHLPLAAGQAAFFFLNYVYILCSAQAFECLHADYLLFRLSLSLELTGILREGKKLAQEHTERNNALLG